jgi:hypothetical protein
VGIQCDNEIGIAGLRTAAEGLVTGIGCPPRGASCAFLVDQVCDTADQSAPHVEPREHLLMVRGVSISLAAAASKACGRALEPRVDGGERGAVGHARVNVLDQSVRALASFSD